MKKVVVGGQCYWREIGEKCASEGVSVGVKQSVSEGVREA